MQFFKKNIHTILGVVSLFCISHTSSAQVYLHRGATVTRAYPYHSTAVVHTGPTFIHTGPTFVAHPVYHPVYVGAPVWGPYWHPVGYTAATIAATAIVVHAIDENNQKKDYYCDNGVYYEKQSNGKYKVVAAPIGSTIKSLPKGSVTLIIEGRTYYYYAGNYYQNNGKEYTVITAPQGAVVNQLPEGTKTEIVNGETYYVCNGIWYTAMPQQNGTSNYAVTTPKN
ncbi:DUF6515 family protein [Flammeovirga agarivorans]|uniref:Uncharacterized protein n=1 Tax=Flammeovirga agarivorans TaxID=2726742 RepID=A0A7X8XUJ1_9BACT|nr:DUF6515 family protein [Flammeovirga agarivorans]NLR90319.1 hypothetical protein [Flammeovirga agarivorans]